MGEQTTRVPSSADFELRDVWILVVLLVLGFVVAAGSLAITSINQQSEMPTGSQTTPTSR